jgi:PilZ domain-containing protein
MRFGENEHRTVARYFLMHQVGGTADDKVVTLVDVSAKGARLELSDPLAPGAFIHLRIASQFGILDSDATVLWSQIDQLQFDGGDDRYLAGVVFPQREPSVESLVAELIAAQAAVLIEDFRSEDRYTITAPLTGSFGEVAPVSVVDLSLHGARIQLRARVAPGTGSPLRFQVDEETGPIDVFARTAWCAPAQNGDGFVAGLQVENSEDQLRPAIHRLCTRGEARIDALSLRRKFDAMRKSAPLSVGR